MELRGLLELPGSHHPRAKELIKLSTASMQVEVARFTDEEKLEQLTEKVQAP